MASGRKGLSGSGEGGQRRSGWPEAEWVVIFIYIYLLFRGIKDFIYLLEIFRFFFYPDMWDLVLVSKIMPCSCYLSVDK
jgi:hypothetical protein